MDPILSFKGTWRTYQARILNRLDAYLKDGKFHLVAAPGSGKTTIGIEVLARLNRSSLVLVPSLTIKNQWLERIQEAFLVEGQEAKEILSGDLRHPKWLTVSTYQALHSLISRQHISATHEATDDNFLENQEDNSDIDPVELFQNLSLGTLCLDECHHLKSDWWKSLETFKKSFPQLATISLTATPPYDSNLLEWTRYRSMCGEVDEEIAVPELVKEGSLCPHQDYLAFSYLTAEEEDQYEHIEAARERLFRDLLQDDDFFEAIQTHRYLQGQMTEIELFDHPDHLLSWLSYLEAQGQALPIALQQLLSGLTIPQFTPERLGILLQAFLYDDRQTYLMDRSYRKALEARIKGFGLIEQGQVMLAESSDLVACLEGSVSKLTSIESIVRDESRSLGAVLRLLILTDNIYRDYMANLGDLDAEVKKVGVLPIFEHLRRMIDREGIALNLAVLCGSLVIIPKICQKPLLSKLETDAVDFQPLAQLEDYVIVEPKGRGEQVTMAMTTLFEEGEIHLLIGTKSFLGEGWDAPCINSLILATTVGSFMLSNQMRGRAIRTWSQNPNKTSNIWHLVTLAPGRQEQLDMQLLERRFQHFMGLSYDGLKIENGLERLGIKSSDWGPNDLAKLQFETSVLALDRQRLKSDWNKALVSHQSNEVLHRQTIPRQHLKFRVEVPKFTPEKGLQLAPLFLIGTPLLFVGNLGFLAFLLLGGGLVSACHYYQIYKYKSAKNKLSLLGQALLTALRQLDPSSFLDAVLIVDETENHYHLSLSQASYREKDTYARLLDEFLSGSIDQRYLIRGVGEENQNIYYPVPAMFGTNKRTALLFFKAIQPVFEASELIYSKNPRGQQMLLEAQAQKLLVNKENHLPQVRTVKRT